MSSMRNAVQRRNHKERAQPAEREKWGLLEKRKDYKLRAADHRSKKAKLKLLSQKARDRNPDEFSFKMMSSKVDKKGKKVADRGNQALSVEVVKLLKTQDAGYIRTMLQMARREREELEQRLILEEQGEARAVKDEDAAKRRKHRVFVENEDEQKEFDPDAWFGNGDELPGRTDPDEMQNEWEDDDDDAEKDESTSRRNTPSKRRLEKEALAKMQARKFRKDRERAQSRTVMKLHAAKQREKALAAAENELDVQRAKMNHTVGGVNKNGVKFKIRERKR